jgi:hypothetical protein
MNCNGPQGVLGNEEEVAVRETVGAADRILKEGSSTAE